MQSYADRVNSKFANRKSHYVDLKQRWNDTLAQFSVNIQNTIRSALNSAIMVFENRYTGINSFTDPRFKLCRAERARLSDIIIDVTMQRQLNVSWVIDIVRNFKPWQAMPIQVYTPTHDIEELRPGELYASWDGQHTAMAFYVIAVMIMKLDPKDVWVPVAIYDVGSKAEIRANFIHGNTEAGQKLLDPIDVATQMIYGVRVDGAVDPLWRQVEEKQTYLENAGLFLTDEKFGDDNEVGAITRVKDITSPKVPVDVVRQFATYAKTIIGLQPRAINTKEAPILLGFFQMAHTDGIVYTDEEVESLAMLCYNLFGADFDSKGRFWNMLERAYFVWWDSHYANVAEELRPARPRMNKDWIQGGTFFWHQLKKSWQNDAGLPMTLPRLNIQTQFVPAKEDLF